MAKSFRLKRRLKMSDLEVINHLPQLSSLSFAFLDAIQEEESSEKQLKKLRQNAEKCFINNSAAAVVQKWTEIFVVLRRRQSAYIQIDFLLIFSWKSLSTKCRSLHSMNYASISPRAVRSWRRSFGSISDSSDCRAANFFRKTNNFSREFY